MMPATPQERAAALWSFAYFFMLLAGYYVLRPLRDQMGIAGGVKNLPWLFTATFVSLLVAQPLYGTLVAKLPRARFIPIVYHFFVANLALFWLLLTLGVETAIVARVFFVWVSVFNLFAFFHFCNHPVENLSLILPIGLSFHTFQSLSYVIEVYRKNYKAEHHFGIYASIRDVLSPIGGRTHRAARQSDPPVL